MKTIGIIIVIIIIVGTIMFFTNPTMEDFTNYLNNKADRNIEKYSQGTEALAENMMNGTKQSNGVYSKSQYERTDYYVFSIYESDSDVLAYGKKHLGVFKVFFKLE